MSKVAISGNKFITFLCTEISFKMVKFRNDIQKYYTKILFQLVSLYQQDITDSLLF